MKNIIDQNLDVTNLCGERLGVIKELEEQFEKKPSEDGAIILRDLLINWRDKWMKEYHRSDTPSTQEINGKIKKYSQYLKN
jgi:hypothetical protein